MAKGAINLGRQKDYQPTQPIYFSHKVHAGINQVNCLYCHGNAWESKHAASPYMNVCMNCHKAISTYEKGPKLLDEEGKEIIVLKLNLKAANDLYDELILKIENATVKGQLFTPETRSDFLQAINPVHKLRVLEPHLGINAWYFKIDDLIIP